MLESSFETVNKLKASLSQVIRGREDTIDLVLTGLLAGGHVLIEDYPGSGKTTLAKALGASIDCSSEPLEGIVPFRRIQFTPDLLPSDVLGVNVFEPKNGSFRFQRGPIFSHIVLADEINRTGPKVQAAFLECMAEGQVTVDNTTYPLDELFFVLGTQNPLDLAGTYPLPLVQLDRFLLKIPMTYVSADTELEILRESEEIAKSAASVSAVVTRESILTARENCSAVTIKDVILETIVNIVQATRSNDLLQFGLSTRSALMFKKSLSAWAIVQGRDYVTEDDVKNLAPAVFLHRLRFRPGAVKQALKQTPQEAFQEFISPFLEDLIRKR